MPIKLSNTHKMPCKSWSLPVISTCPGRFDITTGKVSAVCKGCYAGKGRYKMPKVKALREHNKEDWTRPEWEDDMVAQLDNMRWFRWFDSGDMYHIELAHKIYNVMQRTPWIHHWLPTKMGRFTKFAPILKAMSSLDNVVVRHSSDNFNSHDGLQYGDTASTVVTDREEALTNHVTICPAEGTSKCGLCRKCWDKQVTLIGYTKH